MVMMYSCPFCDNSGHNLNVEDGLCNCPFGMELRKRFNRAYRSIPATPPPDEDPFVVRRIGDPRLKRPMISKRLGFPGLEKHGTMRPY